MKNPKIKTNEICNSCIYNYVIAGCACCGKCGPDWDIDSNGNFTCKDYVKKKEVNNEKKDNNA